MSSPARTRYAYWTAVHRWLAGQDIYQVVPGLDLPPSEGALPYAYAPWSLYLFLPFALHSVGHRLGRLAAGEHRPLRGVRRLGL